MSLLDLLVNYYSTTIKQGQQEYASYVGKRIKKENNEFVCHFNNSILSKSEIERVTNDGCSQITLDACLEEKKRV